MIINYYIINQQTKYKLGRPSHGDEAYAENFRTQKKKKEKEKKARSLMSTRPSANNKKGNNRKHYGQLLNRRQNNFETEVSH